MIVVVGHPDDAAVRALAGAVSARGGRCEVVGAAPPDAIGDSILRGLASLGAGHAAVRRTPARDLDSADLDLALRYLPDLRVIVLVDQDALAEASVAAAAWSGAALIRLTGAPPESTLRVDDRTMVLEPPARDPDGAFAGLVADLAIRLDAGAPLAAAWPATLATIGADTVGSARA